MLLAPQHLTPPEVVSAHVWSAPAEIAATPLVNPITSTGTQLVVEVPLPSWPSPSWPSAFSPQHFAPPEVVTAQVWKYPAEIELARKPAVTEEGAIGAVGA